MNIKPSVIFLNHNYRQKGDAISACHNSRNIMPQHNCHSRKSPYSYHVLFQRQLIFCRCPIKWKASFITANTNKHVVLFLIPTSGLSVCTILHVLILNGVKYLIKDVPCNSKDQALHKNYTCKLNYKQKPSSFIVLVKFNI